MEQEKQIHTEVVDIDDLIQDDHNFNKGTEAGAELIGRSFKEHGAGRSVFIDKNNRLVGGNKAQKGFKGAGYRKVVIVDSDPDTLVAVRRKDVDLDTKEGREMAMLDNLTTQVNLAWDKAELESISDQVEGFDVGDFGFEVDDLPQVVMPTDQQGEGEPTNTHTEIQDDNFDETKEHIETKVKKGDVWQLGNHRMCCGDSTDESLVSRLMNGERADITFSSPPYNMMATDISKIFTSDKVNETYKIKDGTYNEFSDNLSDEEYADLLCNTLQMGLRHSDDVLFNVGILASSKQGIIEMLARNRKNFCDIIVWNKTNSIPLCLPSNRGMISHRCELIFCFNQKGNRSFSHPQWDKGSFNGEMMINRIDSKNASDNEFAKEHHAVFPVEFAGQVVERFSEKSVLEIFGGTGTTLIACEQLNRKCFIMELDPHYCDIIIARWEKLTGQKAIKLNQ